MHESNTDIETPEVAGNPPASALQHAQRKFLILGIVLACIIGAALGWFNHLVKSEAKVMEASRGLGYGALPISSASRVSPYDPPPDAADGKSALPEPTTMAPPPQSP